MKTIFTLLRKEFHVNPTITPEQFLTKPTFVEKKLDIILALIKNCKEKTKQLLYLTRKKQQIN